jgi:hypothetical protein
MRWVSKQNSNPHMGVPSRFGPQLSPDLFWGGQARERRFDAPPAFEQLVRLSGWSNGERAMSPIAIEERASGKS